MMRRLVLAGRPVPAPAVAAVMVLLMLGTGWLLISPGLQPGSRLQQAPTEATRQRTGRTTWHRNGSVALQAWRSSLFPRMAKAYTALEAAEYQSEEGRQKEIVRVEPQGHARYQLFDPVLGCPRGQGLMRLGSDGDGGKLLCPMEELRSKQCLVLSIGSNGQTDFEEAVLKDTPCEVHTFDCTWNGSSIHPDRHTYHKICLGDRSELRESEHHGPMLFKTLPDIVKMLGYRSIDLLKVDIEGFEYEVVSGWEFLDSCSFPTQVSMEVHYKGLYIWTGLDNRDTWSPMVWPMHQLSMAELAVFFGHMADLGYAVVSREDNLPWGEGCCSEFTFIRVEQPAHCRA
ncbi:hypothetical protein ABPG75_001383 [Micractinium tetrahymenae]